MHVSAKVDYAVRALAELAIADGAPLQGTRIAANQRTPTKFTQNILMVLRQHGLVTARRGSGGGFVLACSPHDITLAAVVHAVDGAPLLDVHGEPVDDLAYPGPAAGLPGVWQAAQASLMTVLESVTIADVAFSRARRDRTGRAAAAVAPSPCRDQPTPCETSRPGTSPSTGA